MKIKEFLSPSNVALDVRARDKAGVLKDLSSRVAAALKLSAAAVAEAIAQRDALGSTGIGGGVSIPHARLREVHEPFGLLARLRQPIDFEAIDGQPVDIVFLLLLPASSQLDQLNALAAVARKLREPEVLRTLRAAHTPAELFEILTSGDTSSSMKSDREK
jgi:PTS system nitrogen regulatory IIA component